MRIFLDEVAHTGETVEEVLDPVYRFDKIYCFEPVPSCHLELERFCDPPVEIHRFGLWNKSCRHPVLAPGTTGRNVYREKDESESFEVWEFVRASEWFRDCLKQDDFIFEKLNCEGSECDLLEDLLVSGEMPKIDCLVIDFDVRKIPSQRYRKKGILARLKKDKVKGIALCEDVMRDPTHQARICNWLYSAGADDDRYLFSARRRCRYVWRSIVKQRLRRFLREIALVGTRRGDQSG